LSDIRVLVHSIRAGGKTHLLGDFLKHESQFGEIAYVNTDGEGLMTIKGIGLGNIAYKVEDLKDFKELMKQFAAKPLHALAVDSLQVLERMVVVSVTGTVDRSPISTKEKNEWVDIGREFNNALASMWRATRLLMCTAPSALNLDPITNNPRVISPDLSGQRALGCTGYFEYVGYIKMLVTGPGKVKRVIQFAPDGVTLVRQQMPNAITTDIPIPEGGGGWLAIKTAIEKGMEPMSNTKHVAI
jgi:hypothetical protein